jgi:AraC-like DNA-binding protein
MIPKVGIPEFHALLVRHLREPHFDPHWHYHPEYQLFVVLQGTGTRFVGDQVQRFGPGDLVLTGPNLPHVWRSDDVYFEKGSERMTEGIVIYFREVILNDRLLETQEAVKLRQLLARAERGLSYYGETQRWVAAQLRRLLDTEGFERVLVLLHILHHLSLSDEHQVVSRQGYAHHLRAPDQERMGQVIAYIMSHFTEPIRLRDIAAVGNMSETAFCRYFKEHTNLTLFQFISELRVGYACKLLVGEETTIARAAYESGFGTLSNFNRQFKSVSGLTPREYRRKYAEVLAS